MRLLNNFRYAYRTLLNNPSFGFLAIFTLALGIAGNVVIFSIFNGLYLRPLPFRDSERLVNLDEAAPKWNLENTGLAYFDLCEWRAQNQTFEAMGAWNDARFNLSFKGDPRRVDGGEVTCDLFGALGIQPLLGRVFTREEDQPGRGEVALISQSLWKRLWGGETNVLGQTLSLNSVPHTIVGVLPRDIGPLGRAEVIVPLARSQNDDNGWYLEGVGRLKNGVSLERARQDLTRIHKALIPTRSVNEITSPKLVPLRERLLGDYRQITYVLMGAVAVVWLIACGNVAGLMLARGLRRSKEISIRMALGASRVSIAFQILTESLVLSMIGGGLGVLVGQSILGGLVRLLPENFPNWVQFVVDWRMAVFFILTSAFTAGLFGLFPAVQMASNVHIQEALQNSTIRTTGSARQRRSLNGLVISEIALALILLIGAGLLLQAFQRLQKIDPGFRSENVLTYDIALPDVKYTNTQQIAFFEEHLARLRSLPGVKAAGAVTRVPLDGHSGTFFEIENAPPKGKDAQDPVVLVRDAFPGYREAMGLTLLAGRFISAEDKSSSKSPVVVNESFAHRAWPKQDAIGKRIRYPGTNNAWITVVGLVKDIKHYGFDQPMRPGVYLSCYGFPQSQMTIAVRTSNDPKSLVPAIRALITKTDPDLPMFKIRTMTERVQESLWLRKSYSWLLGFFAIVAVTMALAGIYGVISYAVSQRTNEIGVRMALGAQRSDVLRLVIRHGLLLAAGGIACGLVGAFALTRAMRALLVGVSATDPITFVGVALGLAAVTLLACLIPARRATKVDPIQALRYE